MTIATKRRIVTTTAALIYIGLMVLLFTLIAGCASPSKGPSLAGIRHGIATTGESVSAAQGGISAARTAAQRIDAKAEVLLEHFRR